MMEPLRGSKIKNFVIPNIVGTSPRFKDNDILILMSNAVGVS